MCSDVVRASARPPITIFVSGRSGGESKVGFLDAVADVRCAPSPGADPRYDHGARRSEAAPTTKLHRLTECCSKPAGRQLGTARGWSLGTRDSADQTFGA